MLPIVYGSRYAKSGVDPLETCTWTSAFVEHFRDDAHAWPYVAYDAEGDVLDPQIRIPTRNGVPDHEGTVLCSFLFFDYDGDESHDEMFASLEALPEGHYLLRIACLYLTKGGIRLVYRLSEPVTTEEYGRLIRGMSMDLWRLTGMQMDPSTDQWHRCFRLPNVVRSDDKAEGPTWEEPYWIEPMLSVEAELDPDALPKRTEDLPWKKKSSILRTDDAQEMPDPDQDLIKPRAQLYRAVLRASRWRHYIFDGIPIPDGKRDATFMAMAGEVVAQAYQGVPESDPEEVFLTLAPCTRNIPQTGSEPWSVKLWRLVLHSWIGEEQKRGEREERLEKDVSRRTQTLEAMLERLPAGETPNDENKRLDYAMRHLFLQTGSGAYAVQSDGTYTTTALRSSQLPAHINDGLSYLDPEFHFRTPFGIPLGGDALLNQYSVNLDRVEYVPGQESSAKLVRAGRIKVLQISPFQIREDLIATAEFDKDIDGWLNSFPDPSLLKRWLASAIALDQGGTAALYMHGPARVGKSMLALGLAECFNTQPVPGGQAFANFNDGLFYSPIVMVDEGLPQRQGTGIDPADLFRSMVTGSGISLQKKFQHAVTSSVPYRFVFAANSFDMVRQLIGRRTMSPEDRDAFRERILVCDTGPEPARYLDSRGSMDFTRDWIGKGHRLARHIIKLYQMAFQESQFVRDGRLLVEGRSHAAFTLSFDLSGCGADVVEDLTSDIYKLAEGKASAVAQLRNALSIDTRTGRVWLKRRPYSKVACARSNRRHSEPYSRALDRFLTASVRRSSSDNATEQEVDIEKLVFCATSEGLGTAQLEALLLRIRGVATR